MLNSCNIPHYSTADYMVTRDSLGNYEVRNKSTGKSCYLQGDDALQFEMETILIPVRHLNNAISQYEEVLQ